MSNQHDPNTNIDVDRLWRGIVLGVVLALLAAVVIEVVANWGGDRSEVARVW